MTTAALNPAPAAPRGVRVQAVLINYRTPEMTLESLGAFLAEIGDRREFCVSLVDNASGDGSLEMLRSEVERRGWSDRVEVIESPRNGGFAYGVNVGVNAIPADRRPEYVYLLNSDAFPDRNAVDVLVDFLDANPKVGIAGSFTHGQDGEPHTTAFRFPSMWGELEGAMRLGVVTRLLQRYRVPITPTPTRNAEVDWVAGASMLIRSRVFEEIGPFDDTFFLYYEETDFCLRARAVGWETWYVPESQIMHIGSVSTGMKQTSTPMPAYWFESRSHYFRKNHGTGYLWLSNALWVIAFASWRIRRVLQGKEDPDRPRMLGDFVRAWLG